MGLPFAVFRSFRSRILALSLGPVLLVLGITVTVVVVVARVQVERQTTEQLHAAADSAADALRLRGAQLAGHVEVLNFDYAFKEAVASADAPTLLSAAENQRARAGANFALVLDPDGEPLANTMDSPGGRPVADFRDLVGADADAQTVQTYRLIAGRPYQLVVAPVKAPTVIGWTAMGFALDDQVAGELSKLLGVEVSFLARNSAGPFYLASSLAAAARAAPSDLAAAPSGKPQLIEADGERLLTWSLPLRLSSGSLQIVLQRSLTKAMAPYTAARNSMLALGALLLGVATLCSLVLARSATRPVENLTKAVAGIEAGDYRVVVPKTNTTELGALARAFNTMRLAVEDRESTIRHQAEHDAVTGLPTRNRIIATLAAYLVEPPAAAHTLGVCLVELSEFQTIIGCFGHTAADEVQCEASRRLAAQVARADWVAHLGAGQFLILLAGADRAAVSGRVARVADSLRSTFDYGGASFALEATIGVAWFPDNGREAAELLQRADLALFRAKESSLPIGEFVAGDDQLHRERLAILGELRHAIASDELQLHYQPKVDVATGRVLGCEALLRWQHPVKGFIPPNAFLPHAERTGVIRQLTAWVVRAAMRQQRLWQLAGLPVDVSINVSPVDLSAPDFADCIERSLATSGADPGRIVLEVTESGAMRDLKNTQRMMERLRVIGVRFSIDDFGTGHSSLAHLRSLPVDEIKIDRSFVKEYEDGAADDVILRSTINLGHALKLKVVAEGVERQSSWDALAGAGCDLVQGYFVSKPMPVATFTDWAAARNSAAGSREDLSIPLQARRAS